MAMAKRFRQNPGNSAICYYRYSSEAQRDTSIDQQQQAASAYAEAHGLHIVREYCDRAVSGTRDDRAGYLQMLAEVPVLRPAYLILWKTDRLGRDKIDIVLAKDHLRKNGVRIAYVAEAIPEDDEATAVLMESVIEGFAQYYVVNHRSNVIRGMQYNAERGLYNGVKLLGYTGIVGQPYQLDPATAPVVRLIYQLYADGTPMQRICNKLNSDGIKTSRGGTFNVNSLHRILTNETYLGRYRWGEQVIDGAVPRIIDDALWERVQARLEQNKRGGKGAAKEVNQSAQIADYWLTGKLFCGKCGSGMQGISGTGKSGTTHYYYSCASHRKRRGCYMRNKRKDMLESIVSYILRNIAQEPQNRVQIALKCFEYYQSTRADTSAYEASVASQLHDTEQQLSNIVDAISRGIVSETLQERLSVLEATKHRLQDALAAERQRQQMDLQLDDIVKWLDCFAGDVDNPDQRRQLLDDYVERILCYDDRLVIIMKYTGDEREYLFRETEDIIANQQLIRDILDHKIDTPPAGHFSLYTDDSSPPNGRYTITACVVGNLIGIMASLP